VTREPFRPLIPQLFDDDPAAERVLAIVPDPADPDACVAALLAAQDAISVGQLVVVTHGSGFTGFYASLHAEHPALGITVLRVPESADGLRAAQRLATVEPGRFLELVIDVAGRPHETSMAPVAATGNGTFPLGPADTVLVGCGSDGSGLALAQVLACCGAAIAVIGQDDQGGDGQMLAGLDKLRSAGARVASEVADLTDQAAIAAAVRRIERKLGLVTAIVQAAEPSAPRPLSALTETAMRAQVAAQTAGLSRLMGAVRPERLRLIMTFGSIAGRYGMGRAGLLALASGSLASQAERAAETIPGCQSLHIDWPAWSGSEQDDRHGVPDRLARAGVTLIPVNEGSRLLLKMLTTPDFPASVAVHGRIGLLGRPPAAWRWSGRFLQAVRAYYPGVELVCEARISMRTDPYLSDYLVDDLPVLPTAMALEAMAQAASVLTGSPVRRAAGVSVDSPVVVPTGGADPGAVIRICALRDGETVTVVMRSDESSFAVDHVRAVFSCELQPPEAGTSIGAALPELEEVPASDARIVDGTELYGPVCFQSGRFRRAALLPEVTSRSCRALVRGGDDQPWFSGPGDPADAPLILGSPGLTDATWHVLQACVPHRRLQLAGCDSVLFSGLAADGAVEVRAAIVDPLRQPATDEVATKRKSVVPRQGPGPDTRTPSATSGEFVWDVEAVDTAGRPLVTWSGLRLRDAGPLPRSTPWPPALLAAYLERSTAALGLDPELRVDVQCGQQDGAGSGRQAGTVVPRPAPPADGPFKLSAGSGSSGRTRTSGPASTSRPAGASGAAGSAKSASPTDPLSAARSSDGSPPAHVANGSGALHGFALTVWAPESAVCDWAAAGTSTAQTGTAQAGTAATGGTEKGRAENAATVKGAGRHDPEAGLTEAGLTEAGLTEAGVTEAGIAGLRDDLRKRLSEPPDVLHARLSAVAGCLAAAETGVSSATVVGDGLADDGWVLVRAGGATIACAVVELSGISGPVAIAIMTGTPGQDKQQPVAAGRPRSQSRRQRGRASKHTG
jgi:enediyne polyketide synthase